MCPGSSEYTLGPYTVREKSKTRVHNFERKTIKTKSKLLHVDRYSVQWSWTIFGECFSFKPPALPILPGDLRNDQKVLNAYVLETIKNQQTIIYIPLYSL